MPKKTKAKRMEYLAKKIVQALKDEPKRFNDIICRGGNPMEYGMRNDEKVIADILKGYKW